MLKKILIGVVVVIAVVLIGGLFLPKEMAMEREVVIDKPQAEVFNYLVMLKNQQEWSPWVKMDPNAKNEFVGVDGTVGAIHKWDGNNDIGKGEQEIVNIVPGERVDVALRFEKPMEGDAKAYFETAAMDHGQTKVTWGFSSVSKYPQNIFCFIMNSTGMVEKTFDKGLADLKAILEK